MSEFIYFDKKSIVDRLLAQKQISDFEANILLVDGNPVQVTVNVLPGSATAGIPNTAIACTCQMNWDKLSFSPVCNCNKNAAPFPINDTPTYYVGVDMAKGRDQTVYTIVRQQGPQISIMSEPIGQCVCIKHPVGTICDCKLKPILSPNNL